MNSKVSKMRAPKGIYLISLWGFLLVLAGCEPRTEGQTIQVTSLPKANATQWQIISSQVNGPRVPSDVSRPSNFLKTSVKGPSGMIDLEIRCTNNFVQVIIHLNQNEIQTTPLYSNIHGGWSHTFHVDFMNSTKNISQRLAASQRDPMTNSYIVSSVSAGTFERSESHLKFQTLPKNLITVFYDEHVRAFAKACGSSS